MEGGVLEAVEAHRIRHLFEADIFPVNSSYSKLEGFEEEDVQTPSGSTAVGQTFPHGSSTKRPGKTDIYAKAKLQENLKPHCCMGKWKPVTVDEMVFFAFILNIGLLGNLTILVT